MKIWFLFIVSHGLWANTLLETQTAVGIANTLQGTAQGNPTKILNHVKDTVNNHEIQAPSPAPASSAPSNNNPETQQRRPQALPENNPVLDQATLSEQERHQIQDLSNSPHTVSNPNIIDSPNSLNNSAQEEGPEITERNQEVEEYLRTEKIIAVEDMPMDYKAKTQIFYKKNCLPSQSDCKRSGAVFTNIQSVIFNYAHSRGSFSEEK